RNEDGEGVHQMRVGLRRMRAAMSVFKGLLGDRESRRIKTELKWLTEQLGPARDLDVFVSESIEPMQQEQRGKKGMPALKKALETRRTKGFEQAKRAVESERYDRLVVRTALWLSGGNWLRKKDNFRRARRDRPIGEFASEVLSKRCKKIVKRAKKLEK